jgi:chemotaxis protein MotB
MHSFSPFRPARWLRLLPVGALLLGSCVTAKRYDDLKAQASQDASTREQAELSAKKATEELNRLQGAHTLLRKRVGFLASDSIRTEAQLNKERAANAELNTAYEKLMKANDRMLANSASDLDRTSRDLLRRESELRAAEARNLELSKGLKVREDSVQNLNSRLVSREAKVRSLEQKLSEQQQAVANLRQRVASALTGFTGPDLSVQVKNGKVYVSLSEQLLFKSGSTKVDAKGQEALKTLAGALAAQTDVNVLVEGHTDDVPLRAPAGSLPSDNWDLSVLRATQITRLLTTNGVAPNRVTAAGHSQYVPVEAGTTAEIRQKNRRTEIILTPKLDELFKLLDR